jgi:molybdopterin synthase sulfur carrier subunit
MTVMTRTRNQENAARPAERGTRSVTILYFASVREGLGMPNEIVAMPGSVTTVGDLLRWLRSRGPEYAAALDPALRLRVAVDRVHAADATMIGAASEIAIFPMMTGG